MEVGQTTVRDYVRKRRRELGLTVCEAFVPQVHAPGRTAEVDWGEADVDLAGALTRVHLFHMRACFSGAAFSMASPVETQQAFLEGHALAFEWFGGVFAEVRTEYVPGHIFIVLCPSWLCGHWTDGPRCSRRSVVLTSGCWAHNGESEVSQFSSVSSVRQIGVVRNPTETSGGSVRSSASCLALVLISA